VLGAGLLKRTLDVVLAASALLVLGPLMAAAALLVRWDSPGPVLYGQERVGRDGVRFTMWKLRSMYMDNDDRYHREAASAWFAGAPAPNGYKIERDPRITPVGRFLRRTTVDELPQLFNVIRGEMSLVGPRPAIPYELQYYQDWYFERQKVKPGMTGLWQVSGRDRVSAAEMMSLDARYVREWSLGSDLSILVRTVPAVISRLGKGTRGV
jgi:lipopolysaccharide/colanic/teichoic acid biosynthesis glycosyltransferase